MQWEPGLGQRGTQASGLSISIPTLKPKHRSAFRLENDGWIDEHVVEDTEFAALNPYGAIQRVTGIASIRAGTEFFPKIRQESGTSTLVFAFNYFKIIRLVDYPALSELRSASVFD
jgi:hypothetical protein